MIDAGARLHLADLVHAVQLTDERDIISVA